MGSDTASSGGGNTTPNTVRAVVHDVVAQVAPEELPIVAGLATMDEATVRRRLAEARSRREPLGFGLVEVIALVTPVVWLAVDHAAERIAESAVDGAAKGSRTLLRRLFRRRRRVAAAVVPPLSTEQLIEVRRLVLEQAATHGLDEPRASMVADAVVARLATRDPGAAPADPPPS
ncbi:hypothetical protein [Actinoalloteichus hymeniacidonis]|uniref:Uncharacterized protein n=1 Tax=Actinoalloteichus hymeniacidonis TaxID=340345 RepID=A0AAC9MZL1_9PSEU|nr:hypothetical protein [Actinoalloteichus hymeniacidonis]AOS64559.1 hypothetical protein TL08_18840 [Actinoalloteichus hymeniacidonis]MBB5907369.1 hypothetical protein [Actinoalloteichus hymeniacidonis]